MSDVLNDPQAWFLRCESLLEQCRSLQLATLDEEGFPHISYAPYLFDEGVLYIFISQLASHTQHLLGHSAVSLMVIKDESLSKNLFARERLLMKAIAAQIIDTEERERLLDAMQQRLGNTISVLRTLPDFVLMSLTPKSARYVAGFGKAVELEFESKQSKSLGVKSEGS